MLNDKQKVFVDILKKEYPDAVEVRRGDLLKIHKKHKLPFPYWLVNDDQYKVGKGMFKVPVDGSTNDAVADEPKSETKSEAAYIGNYIPPSTPETAGFNTNGKTRGTILSKLEEVLRNKQIMIKSSRFYEELKTFTWSSGKAQAKRGYHDDLVMSFAIGTWLFDAAGGYSKDSKALNDAIDANAAKTLI